MVATEPISEPSLASNGCGLPGDRVSAAIDRSIERTNEHLETSQIPTYMINPMVVVFLRSAAGKIGIRRRAGGHAGTVIEEPTGRDTGHVPP